MSKDFNSYSGELLYKEITFTFLFSGEELRLIPPKEQEATVDDWFREKIPVDDHRVQIKFCTYKMETLYLVGKCNENGRTIIFILKEGASVSSYNTVLVVPIVAYIECRYDRNQMDRIAFTCSEIDGIHPTKNACELSIEEPNLSDGILSLTTKDFATTTTDAQMFCVDEKEVAVSFSMSWKASRAIGHAPLEVNSVMYFEFAPTDDYTFIYRLWKIGKTFIQYLCYRRNVFIPSIEIGAPAEGGLHEPFATMYVIGEYGELEMPALESERYIRCSHIVGSEGRILNDIAEGQMYLRHLPESCEAGKHIDASRFIMITAAFEWEFHRMYPEGIPKSEKTLKVEEEAYQELSKLIEGSSGKLKEKYKFLRKLVKADSLQLEIKKVGEDLDAVLGTIGKHLYHMNQQSLDYTEMGTRLGNQRNHFAHGDLDKEFIGVSLLDLIFLEYIIYVMQMKYYGMEDNHILRAINELFHLNYYISDEK